MFKNYFKTAFRNIARNKLYSFIKITGLAIGIATSLLILLYVLDELSYDKFHSKYKQIYRVATDFIVSGKTEYAAVTPAPEGPALKKDYPEILDYVRAMGFNGNSLIEYKNEKFNESAGMYADPSLFNVFDFKVIKGNKNKLLTEPHTIVLTEDMATKIFGEEEPVGKIVLFDKENYTVTGVIENVPFNSHLKFTCLIPFTTLGHDFAESWTNHTLYTYILLPENSEYKALEAKLPSFCTKYFTYLFKVAHATIVLHLQPLANIHLHSNLIGEASPSGNQLYILIFSIVAAFILLIACINYINLSTALSESRFKEVGLRKVFGGIRQQLTMQFLVESFIITIISLGIGLSLVELLIPWFNKLTEKNIPMFIFTSGHLIIPVLLITITTALISGSYPALYISKLKPIEALRKKINTRGNKFNSRMLLVIFQFSISAIIIIATIIVYQQLQYVKNKNTGFNKENIAIIELQDTTLKKNTEMVKNMLNKIPGVISTAMSTYMPAETFNPNKNLFKVESDSVMVSLMNNCYSVDYDYIDLMQMQIVQGRKFLKEISTDEKEGFIANEAFVKKMGWKEPIGKKIGMLGLPTGYPQPKIIGVVADFNYTSLRQEIEPMLIRISNKEEIMYQANLISIRLKPENMAGTLKEIERVFKNLDPQHPVEYHFLDDYISQQYTADEKVETLFTFFGIISVLIACLGLFGLASHAVVQRTKEIGVRKVLGSSVKEIVLLINRDFIRLVFVSMIIAFPLAYYFMNKFLMEFAYHINIGPLPFVIAGTLSLVIAFITISFITIRGAVRNPVESLRYE